MPQDAPPHTQSPAAQRRLCASREIAEGQSKGFDDGDRGLFVVHKNGQFFAYRNRCPHLGIELNWQEDQFLDLDGMLIACATHGALFLIEDGLCVAGPCTGQALQALPLRILDGEIYLAEEEC